MLIKAIDVFDIRFPTSQQHIGSDAMNLDPDYSAAYACCAPTPNWRAMD